jgi:[ribosomal protein S5]-alanine N-acetyltransferase
VFDATRLKKIGPIQSARLRLEPLRAEHAEGLFAGFSDPALYEWISTPRPETIAALANSWVCSGDHGPFYWEDFFGLDWAVIRTQDNTTIGKFDADFATDGRAINLGYVLQRTAWGKGYGVEAVGALLAELDFIGVYEIRAYVTKGNTASVRLLERLGFRAERILPDNDTIRGQLFDDIEFVRNSGRASGDG